ncbi:MAG TPA: sodium-translocating pyrophosphatase [Candidatus Bathyarchaeia archaeon]|nr:sodium-translocating pyrophosphatase [Candidatus Bathyarchaeia archaeon]
MAIFDATLFPFGVGLVAILVAIFIIRWILKKDSGTDRMKEVSGYIVVGTRAYLKRQIKTIFLAMPWLAALLSYFFGWQTSLTFICGALLSLLAGYIGMNVAVRANVRATNAARKSSAATFRLSFMGGAVTGLLVTGISMLGLYVLRLIFSGPEDLQVLVGFGFGASLAALFAQIGGGIFTKSADIGADLVGKLEEGIPEDDPRNPAVVADLVGDNVGDCAGRGSDLFQTFSDDIITGMILGVLFVWKYGPNAIIFPFVLESVGVVASMIGISIVKERKRLSHSTVLYIGLLTTAIIGAGGLFILANFMMNDITLFLAGVFGIIAMLTSTFVALYYTGLTGKPVRQTAECSKGGPAINVITGLSFGLQSPILPIVAVIASIVLAYWVSGGSAYALIAANISTDIIITFIMASDTFGPITDNAGGIAEMSGISGEASKTLEGLDAVGNTMKAATKAYAMASGTYTSFTIFATYFAAASIIGIDVTTPYAIAGLFIGVALPFPLASLTISATAKGAFKMVDEVRRQFKEILGLREGKATPDYAKCIDISTKFALKQMVLPGLLAIAVPITVGLLFGPTPLGMLLIGATASSAMLGFFFNNTGALLDNAKKLHETGLCGTKGSESHKASIVGDTVGDPLKDVAGPSVLIFMKLLGMTALLMLPAMLG